MLFTSRAPRGIGQREARPLLKPHPCLSPSLAFLTDFSCKQPPINYLPKDPYVRHCFWGTWLKTMSKFTSKIFSLMDKDVGWAYKEDILASYSTQIWATYLQCFKTHIHNCHIPLIIQGFLDQVVIQSHTDWFKVRETGWQMISFQRARITSGLCSLVLLTLEIIAEFNVVIREIDCICFGSFCLRRHIWNVWRSQSKGQLFCGKGPPRV